MKLQMAGNKQPSNNLLGCPGAEPASFLNHIAKQIGVKKLAYAMHVSEQYMRLVLRGDKPDSLSRARIICEIARESGNPHLVAPILLYVAGDDFTGMVLDD